MEHVLVIVKPDGVVKGLVGHILTFFLRLDLQLTAMKLVTVSRSLAEAHYKQLENKPFYEEAVDLLLGKFHGQSKVFVLIYSGEDAVRKSRDLAGATNPEEALPNSIRGAFGRITTKGVYENIVHVSSDPLEAEREIKLWFEPDDVDAVLYETKMSFGMCKKRTWKCF
jgi:nucleoside-diphosphate kinase